MEGKQKLDVFGNYDKILKFVPAIIGNDIIFDILKIAVKWRPPKNNQLLSNEFGEEIMFKKVIREIGNIEPVSIGTNVKPASISTKPLVNVLSINKRSSVSYNSLAQIQNEEKIIFSGGIKNELIQQW